MSVEMNHCNLCNKIGDINVGDILVIKRKYCGKKYIVQCKGKTDSEIILSKSKNDYFNFDMYYEGDSWVHRVWNLGSIDITSITNNINEFPRR